MSAQSIMVAPENLEKRTFKDMASDQEIRWCPGCGDYSILRQVQMVTAALDIPRKDMVFFSGIGCSSRFPYYMDTYGFHTIHGRALTFASGLKITRPELNIWVVTGDGDGLSIGGNHLIHAMRRNFDINVLLFNNRIYGLTKGQYSPASELHKVTKTSPFGSVERPLNPLRIAMAAEATFVARASDADVKHLAYVLSRAQQHKGISFVEIYQNCNIFNDKAFADFSERSVRSDRTVKLEHGKPLIFGADANKGIRLNGPTPEVVSLENGTSVDDLLVMDEHCDNPSLAYMLTDMDYPDFPVPFGVFRDVPALLYEEELHKQIATAESKPGAGDLNRLFRSAETWEVEGNGR